MGVTFRYNASVEGIRRVPSSGAGSAALQDVAAVPNIAAAQPAGELGSPDGPSSSEEEEDRGGERLASEAEARLRGTDGRGPRRRPSTSEPPQQQHPSSGGWECELKDGARHRCDRLVSREYTKKVVGGKESTGTGDTLLCCILCMARVMMGNFVPWRVLRPVRTQARSSHIHCPSGVGHGGSVLPRRGHRRDRPPASSPAGARGMGVAFR